MWQPKQVSGPSEISTGATLSPSWTSKLKDFLTEKDIFDPLLKMSWLILPAAKWKVISEKREKNYHFQMILM